MRGTVPGVITDFWVPVSMIDSFEFSGVGWSGDNEPGKARLDQRGTRWLFLKGRLGEQRTVEQAARQVDTIFAGLRSEYPAQYKNVQPVVLPAASDPVSSGDRRLCADGQRSAARCGGPRAPDCLRQRGQHAARAQYRTQAGTGDSRGDRCGTRADRPATPWREHGAGNRRGCPRDVARVLGQPGDLDVRDRCVSGARGLRSLARSGGAGLCARRVSTHGGALRHGASMVGIEVRPRAGTQCLVVQHRFERRQTPAIRPGCARGRADGVHARAAGRRDAPGTRTAGRRRHGDRLRPGAPGVAVVQSADERLRRCAGHRIEGPGPRANRGTARCGGRIARVAAAARTGHHDGGHQGAGAARGLRSSRRRSIPSR